MPQNGMNIEGRRRQTCHNTCGANGLINSQMPSSDLVNGAADHNDFPAAATRTGERTPAGTPNGTKPQYMVNGYINHGYKGTRTKAPPRRTFWKQRSTISATTGASTAGRVSSRGTSGAILVNEATSLDILPRSDQMAPEPSLSASAKNRRRRRKPRHKKRDTDLACVENPTPPLMPPQEEDWEKEIQEVTITNWEKMCFGVQSYGPEDVLHFALRDLTLQQRDSVDPPVTANYSPSTHHPRPVKWFCYSIPTEPDQFADAD